MKFAVRGSAAVLGVLAYHFRKEIRSTAELVWSHWRGASLYTQAEMDFIEEELASADKEVVRMVDLMADIVDTSPTVEHDDNTTSYVMHQDWVNKFYEPAIERKRGLNEA